ncbi:MAG TPA: DsbA family protein [Candidatus Nanoarchaeia archaeon]|nr:DsbA family protein [Candidatus Nanoarchaeia archaeon]
MSESDIIEIKLPKFLHGNATDKIRKNPWIASTFVLGILILALLYNNISGGTSISADSAGERLLDFLNQNSESEIMLRDISLENGLYKANVEFQGNVIPLYITRDGNYLFQEPIPLTSNPNSNGKGGFVSASEDDDAVLGSENAEITIIEFSDYQCPFCRKFWTETFKELKTNYIDTGKVKLVYRDFPLTNIHSSAQVSAEAAECVREQGGDSAYWKMHDKIFTEQNILDSGSASGAVTKTITYTATDLKDWAKELGYDIGSCLDSEKYKSEVLKDSTDGQSAGVGGTPYFIVMKTNSDEGVPLSGAQPLSVFEQVIGTF